MTQQNYSSSITAKISAGEAFDRITCISDWWTAGVQGSSRNPGDEFTVRFGEPFVAFKVVGVTLNRRAVWLVTDRNLHWINNKKEWKKTKLGWDLSPQDGGTQVTMTHLGLAPGIECYNDCATGWDFYIRQSQLQLLIEGQGLPDRQRRKSTA